MRAGRGAVVELTPTEWAKDELKGSLLWNFNRIYDARLAEQQKPSSNLIGINIDRETIAGAFPLKKEYTIEDAVKFVRAQIGPDGTDYSWSGTKFPICNWMASQMMIFDSKSNGFYMAVGPYFAARQNIYHFYDDFSKQPELFMPAIPIEPVIEQAAQIENRLISRIEKLQAFINLASQYKNDANVQFIVAYKSFQLSKLDSFATYAEKAYATKPDNAEYRIYAGMAAYQKKDTERAINLLDQANGELPGIGNLQTRHSGKSQCVKVSSKVFPVQRTKTDLIEKT